MRQERGGGISIRALDVADVIPESHTDAHAIAESNPDADTIADAITDTVADTQSDAVTYPRACAGHH